MTWETFDWRPADDASLGSGAAVLPLWPMLQSALSEAVSAMILGPATVGDVEVVHVDAADLPAGFVPVSSFELLGTARRVSWAALDPSGADHLVGVEVTADALQRTLLEGLDGGLEAIVGEGLGLKQADEAAAPAGPLVLLRLPITAGDETVRLVAAFEAAVPAEFAAHIVALQALAGDVLPDAASTAPAGTPDDHAAGAPVDPLRAPLAPPASPQPAPVPATLAPASASPVAPAASIRQPSLPEFAAVPTPSSGHNIDLLLGVNLEVSVEIGRTHLAIRDVLALTPGSIVELDKLAGEKVDVLVNGHRIASGEVVVVDENFGVRIVEVVSRHSRILSADHAA